MVIGISKIIAVKWAEAEKQNILCTGAKDPIWLFESGGAGKAFNKTLQDEEHKPNSVSQGGKQVHTEGSVEQMKSDVGTNSRADPISFSLQVSHSEIHPKPAIRQRMASS